MDLLEEEKFSEAAKLLADIDVKYADTPWFASHRMGVEAAQAKAKGGVYEDEAEKLYLEEIDYVPVAGDGYGDDSGWGTDSVSGGPGVSEEPDWLSEFSQTLEQSSSEESNLNSFSDDSESKSLFS